MRRPGADLEEKHEPLGRHLPTPPQTREKKRNEVRLLLTNAAIEKKKRNEVRLLLTNAAIEKQPFYAGNLGRDQQERARAMCNRAGLKEGPAFDDCVLDVTVLGTERAAIGLLHVPRPVAVWQAGSGSSR